METGVVTLINTKQYPFNNSAQTSCAPFEQSDTDYFVLTEVIRAEGETGEIRVYDKAVNGFRIAFDGSARCAEIRYLVIKGGL